MKRKRATGFDWAEDLTGLRFHVLGSLSRWPRLLGGGDVAGPR